MVWAKADRQFMAAPGSCLSEQSAQSTEAWGLAALEQRRERTRKHLAAIRLAARLD